MSKRTKHFHPLLYVIHVGSCGGASVHDVLIREYFGEERPPNFEFETRFTNWNELYPIELKKQIRYISGHGVRYGIDELFGIRGKYLAILRDPVAHTESLFRLAHRSTHLIHEPLKTPPISLPQFARYLGNYFVHALADLPPDEQGPALSEERAQQALHEIKRAVERDFLLVGTIPQFDRILFYLARELGWSRPRLWQQIKIFPKPDEPKVPLDAEAREAIIAARRVDFELVEWAEHRFEEQFSAALRGTDFEGALDKYCAANARYSALVERYPTILPSFIEWLIENPVENRTIAVIDGDPAILELLSHFNCTVAVEATSQILNEGTQVVLEGLERHHIEQSDLIVVGGYTNYVAEIACRGSFTSLPPIMYAR